MKHLVLEKMADNDTLEIIPSEYWILHCFFIILDDGRFKYLPLTYPIYKIDNSKGIIEGGLWTPPYVAKKIESTVKRLNTPRSIRRMISQYREEHKNELDEDVDYLFYYLGVQDYELVKLSEFTEYKTSYSESTKMKCYHIINYMVTNVDKAGVINIVDPECMRNLHFMKLDIDVNNLPRRENEEFPSYNGKILASNLYKVLNENLNSLLDVTKINKVDNNFLQYECEGILFSYDINSSAVLRNEIENKYVSLCQNGYDISEDFLSKILVIFTQVLSANNIYQYRLEGDGFVAAIPESDYKMLDIEKNDINLTQILNIAYQCDTEINKMLANGQYKVTSKVALQHGKYRYGKIGGIEARSTTFSGKDMFSFARLREGVARWNRDNGSDNTCYGVFIDDSHFSLNDEECINTMDISIKESNFKIGIFRR